jgi:hypothetical protein
MREKGMGMRSMIQRLADKAATRVLGQEQAGACYPEDPYNTCYHHAKLHCNTTCNGSIYCYQIGSC